MAMLVPFIIGWFGTLWPGIWYDKPRPGGSPWGTIVLGILGGIVGVLIMRMSIADSNPMPGMVLVLAAGAVVAHLVGTLWGGMTAKS